VRPRSLVNPSKALGLALAVAALLSPVCAFALLDPHPERPAGLEITELEAPALAVATPSRAPGLAPALILPGASVSAPPPGLEEFSPDARASTGDQLRWSVAHGTTSSLH
jgi:hypothetical protein